MAKKKAVPAPIVDAETIWWFAESMKFHEDSTMLKICKSHEVLRGECSDMQFIIRELHNFLQLDPSDQVDEDRKYLLQKTKPFMVALTLPAGKKG
jgi:hypothetical protein